ncbi:hypothetical protein HYU13_00545 [Candidatus Woesearchaeota archaeon]|nr:hypothetical protein [Candidatus Woesearchaeota archaeon]
MGTIIGVLHFEKNLERLIEHIDAEYGTPRSLMLELPVDWREFRMLSRGYFEKLAEEYERRGTRIIAGDKNHYRVEHPKLMRLFKKDEEEFRERQSDPGRAGEPQKDKWAAIAKMVLYMSSTFLNTVRPSNIREINLGILEAYNESNPDLAIVGCMHAKYLKKMRPDSHYTFFHSDSFFERLGFPLHYYLTRSARADSYVYRSRSKH